MLKRSLLSSDLRSDTILSMISGGSESTGQARDNEEDEDVGDAPRKVGASSAMMRGLRDPGNGPPLAARVTFRSVPSLSRSLSRLKSGRVCVAVELE